MLTRILAIFAGIGGFLALLFRGRLKAEQADRAKEDLEREKTAHKTSQKATEALVRGLNSENDSEDTNNPRDYDFRD